MGKTIFGDDLVASAGAHATWSIRHGISKTSPH